MKIHTKPDQGNQDSSENTSSKNDRSAPTSQNSFVSINKFSTNTIVESDISHDDKDLEQAGKPKLESFEHILNSINFKKNIFI
jgi:hypothetical protein